MASKGPEVVSRSSSAAMSEVDELQDKLDHLWAQYLKLLDQYESAQTAIAKSFSNGFFSLAQANFKSTGGRRFGRDYYDERMKASRRCRIDNEDDQIHVYTAVSEPSKSENGSSDEESSQQPTPPATPDSKDATDEIDGKGHDDARSESSKPDDEDNTSNSGTPVVSKSNPLHWYGILVPRELRSSQASFASIIDDHIAAAANNSKAMRIVEADIRKTRKVIRKLEKSSAAQQPSVSEARD